MTFEIGMVVWLVLANVLAYALFLHDKRAAIRGARRIPEDRLLAVAFLGGWLGAKLAQHLLRHKIRTEPFRQQLNGIIAVQVLAVAAIYAMHLVERGALMRGLGG